MKALLLALLLLGCSSAVTERHEPLEQPEPGSLGAPCAGNADCTATPRFMSCEEGTCRAWCRLNTAPLQAAEGLEENCYAMGGSCDDNGECVR